MPRALGDAVLVSVNSVGFAGSAVLILRTLSALAVQRLPSGPVTIACGVMTSLTVKIVSAAGFAGGTFTIAFDAVSQRLPSGPARDPLRVRHAGERELLLGPVGREAGERVAADDDPDVPVGALDELRRRVADV